MRRRTFVGSIIGGSLVASLPNRRSVLAVQQADAKPAVQLTAPNANEDVFTYIDRIQGRFDRELYLKILGAANEFKEGDAIVGVAAADNRSRAVARRLLSETLIAAIDAHPPWSDELSRRIQPTEVPDHLARLTLSELKHFLLSKSEAEIHAIKGALSSDVIACVVKLLTDAELISVGSKVFNPLPNSQIGARGYLGARIQPNSPTDNLDDIRWQVFDGFAYAVGDVLIGTNPVSSDPDSVAAIERALQDILATFDLQDAMPHCVLAHIDVQAEVEAKHPGATELWFQSIAGNDSANTTFDISIDKMLKHARARTGRYGLYFETGQGADFTNGHSHGMDMLMHESRKYGLARTLAETVCEVRRASGQSPEAWVHVNDVAGFIGPEVFRSKEQLVRCCLEDIVMGKLHGLTIGLDVCSTLHMDVSLDDLDWCLDQVAPANPAYLMALPTKIDPMLGYLTTGFQDHVRLREKFGLQVNDRMWNFFKELGVIDADGQPTKHFGDPTWVFLQYQRRKGDTRADEIIRRDAREQLNAIRKRGVFIAEGHGAKSWELNEQLGRDIKLIYDDAKLSIWREWDEVFIETLPPQIVRLSTQSINREDYILHPTSGEHLSEGAKAAILDIRHNTAEPFNCVLVVSEGLNALAAMDEGQLEPLVAGLRGALASTDYHLAPQLLVVNSGRVRAGYRIGELLFQGIDGKRTVIHIIGERPGSGHHTLSVYITSADGSQWSIADQVDHNITRVVSGIATTALLPELAVKECMKILT